MHSKYGNFELIFNGDGSVVDPKAPKDGKVREEAAPKEYYSDYAVHGVNMYFTWFGMALISFVSKRYFKTFWCITDLLHILSGLVMLMLTLWTTILMIDKIGLDKGFHSIMGLIITFLCILLGINGIIVSISARFGQQPDWTPHERSRKIARIHRWLGGITIFMAGITITLGLFVYSFKGGGEISKKLGLFNIFVFNLTFIGIELCFR
jgi:hypothetical protein